MDSRLTYALVPSVSLFFSSGLSIVRLAFAELINVCVCVDWLFSLESFSKNNVRMQRMTRFNWHADFDRQSHLTNTLEQRLIRMKEYCTISGKNFTSLMNNHALTFSSSTSTFETIDDDEDEKANERERLRVNEREMLVETKSRLLIVRWIFFSVVSFRLLVCLTIRQIE